MLGFDYQWIGINSITRYFHGLTSWLAEKLPSSHADFIKSKLLEEFVTGVDPWGTPWARLSPVTLAMRNKRGNSSTRILVDTGAMMNSLRVIKTKDSVSIDIAWPGALHQVGFVSKWGPVPARPILPLEGDKLVLPDSWSRSIDTIFDKLVKTFT